MADTKLWSFEDEHSDEILLIFGGLIWNQTYLEYRAQSLIHDIGKSKTKDSLSTQIQSVFTYFDTEEEKPLNRAIRDWMSEVLEQSDVRNDLMHGIPEVSKFDFKMPMSETNSQVDSIVNLSRKSPEEVHRIYLTHEALDQLNRQVKGLIREYQD